MPEQRIKKTLVNILSHLSFHWRGPGYALRTCAHLICRRNWNVVCRCLVASHALDVDCGYINQFVCECVYSTRSMSLMHGENIREHLVALMGHDVQHVKSLAISCVCRFCVIVENRVHMGPNVWFEQKPKSSTCNDSRTRTCTLHTDTLHLS